MYKNCNPSEKQNTSRHLASHKFCNEKHITSGQKITSRSHVAPSSYIDGVENIGQRVVKIRLHLHRSFEGRGVAGQGWLFLLRGVVKLLLMGHGWLTRYAL